MKTEIRINKAEPETRAVLISPSLTSEVEQACRLLEGMGSNRIIGFSEGKAVILDPASILRIWAEDDDVYAKTERRIFRLKNRLYEVESRLDPSIFVRISRSEIINLDRAESFDLSLMGTIEIRMKDGHRSYVARRNVKKLKEVLGL